MPKRMQHQLMLAMLTTSIALNAMAVGKGLYMGLMAGPATNSASNQQAQVEGTSTTPPTTVLATPKSQQFGSRVLLGYMINPYVGMEGGLTYFSTIRYDTGNVNTCSGANARVRDIDFLVKGVVPVRDFNVFGKAGVAFTYQATSGAFNPAPGELCGPSNNITKAVPTISLGAGYDLTQNWVADLSMNTTMMSGKVGNMTMLALGISYHFVDVYCGQFLCN